MTPQQSQLYKFLIVISVLALFLIFQQLLGTPKEFFIIPLVLIFILFLISITERQKKAINLRQEKIKKEKELKILREEENRREEERKIEQEKKYKLDREQNLIELKKIEKKRSKKYKELRTKNKDIYDDRYKLFKINELTPIREEIKKIELEILHEKASLDPDINLEDPESYKCHFSRLEKFGRSKFLEEYYYMGERGGIYTLSANGTRNYKY